MRSAGHAFTFARNERIHIEDSHKYTLPQLDKIVRAAGFVTDAILCGERRLFGVHLLSAA